MNILLVEDEKEQVDILLRHIHTRLGRDVRIMGPYDEFSSVLPHVERKDISLAIIDINLHGDPYAGIHIGEMIQRLLQVAILFVSGITDEQTVERAKEVSNSNFLQKPYDEASVNRAIERVTKPSNGLSDEVKVTFRPRGRDRYWVKTDRSTYHGVDQHDILCVEAYDHYCKIHINGFSSPLITKASLKRDIWEGGLRTYQHFFLLNRSIIINLGHVKRVEGNVLHIEGVRLEKNAKLTVPKEKRDALYFALGLDR